VSVDIVILMPVAPEGAGDCELLRWLEEFFGPSAEFLGHGCSLDGTRDLSFNYKLADGEDVEAWVARLCEFLRGIKAGRGTFLAVYPEGWRPRKEYHRVDLFGRHAGRMRRCT
jgi:hypothetical protein